MSDLPIELNQGPPQPNDHEWYQRFESVKKVLVDFTNDIAQNTFATAIGSTIQDLTNEAVRGLDTGINAFRDELTETRRSIGEFRDETSETVKTLEETMNTRMDTFQETMNTRMDTFQETMNTRMDTFQEKMGNETSIFINDVNNVIDQFRSEMNEKNSDITIMKDEILKLNENADQNEKSNQKIAEYLNRVIRKKNAKDLYQRSMHSRFSRCVLFDLNYQLTPKQLRFIARKLATDLGIPIPGRKEMRNNSMLIAWYDYNYDTVVPKFIEFVSDQKNIESLPPSFSINQKKDQQ